LDEADGTFDDLVAARLPFLSPAEAKVARLFLDSREEVLFASVAALGARAGTSDATVIRAARTLGFGSMGHLRRRIADDTRRRLTQADRLTATLGEAGGDLGAALTSTLDVHAEALSGLRRDLSPNLYAAAVAFVADASGVVVSGIGPSSLVAEYLALQLNRFGLRASTLTEAGLPAADGLCRLREGDRVVVLAYGPPRPEVLALVEEAERLHLGRLLVTDTLVPPMRHRFDLVLSVARGRADMLSLHAATVALVETILVGVATVRPAETLASLERLNALRRRLAGDAMGVPGMVDVTPRREGRGGA
jgi:DNA-binding MurR/RpiR family transcriptional regulator